MQPNSHKLITLPLTYLSGIRDVFQQGGYLTIGMTWSEGRYASRFNNTYDKGANMGEKIHLILRLERNN